MRDLTLQEMDRQLAEQLPARELMGGCCRQKCTYQPEHKHSSGTTVIASPGNGNGSGNGNGDGHVDGKSTATQVQRMLDDEKLTVSALPYIRGRSLTRIFFIDRKSVV